MRLSRERLEPVARARGFELVKVVFRGANRWFLVSNDVRVRLGLRAAAEQARKCLSLAEVASLLDA